jgi:GntR family transcriptional regulator
VQTIPASPLPVPRYHQIYLVLRERLAAGEFAADAPMPGEVELARSYGVSRMTLRAALDLLAQDKLIVRQRGRGTFARGRQAGGPAPMLGLLENLVANGLRTVVKIIELTEVPAAGEVADALRIRAGEPVQRAVRLRSFRGSPVSHLTTFVPAAIARFSRKELAAKPMLRLLEEAGVRVAGAEQTISARLSDPATAPLLNLGVGSPLLSVRRIVHDESNRPVQLLRGLYRPDRYHYCMRLTRAGADVPSVWVSDHGSTPA